VFGDIALGGMIGQGGFGRVYRGTWRVRIDHASCLGLRMSVLFENGIDKSLGSKVR
jgi:hypothetical protein